MDSATDEPLSDALLEACANAALDGAPLLAPPPSTWGQRDDLSGHKRQWAAAAASFGRGRRRRRSC